jgi:hypothetical protein
MANPDHLATLKEGSLVALDTSTLYDYEVLSVLRYVVFRYLKKFHSRRTAKRNGKARKSRSQTQGSERSSPKENLVSS